MKVFYNVYRNDASGTLAFHVSAKTPSEARAVAAKALKADVATLYAAPSLKASPRDLYAPLQIEQYDVGGNEVWRVAGLVPIKHGRMNSLEASILPCEYPQADHDDQRLVVACGMGTDSIAMLIEMHRQGIRPDVIEWADTGSERRHTYRYVNILNAWLKQIGFPPCVVVRRRCPQAGHRSLFEQAWNTSQLPSAAFFKNHSCSISWKLEPMRRWQALCQWLTRENHCTAIGFDADEIHNRKGTKDKIKEAIGFDADELQTRKSGVKGDRFSVDQEDGYETWFPLAEWGLTRDQLVEVIQESELPQPGKSACFCCPVSKLCELKAMDNGELTAALTLERRFGEAQEERGPKAKYRGMRKTETWADWLESDDRPDIEPIGLVPDQLPDPEFT